MSEDRIAKLGAKIEDLEGIRVDQISIIKGLRKRIADLESALGKLMVVSDAGFTTNSNELYAAIKAAHYLLKYGVVE